jgi:dynein assembly factor with WDR repeat domains 1
VHRPSSLSFNVFLRISSHFFNNFFSQISFNPQGTKILTASADKTARLWDPETGECKQILEGHTDEIFSCAFNYEGAIIITGKSGY